MKSSPALAITIAALSAACVHASTTATWEMNTFQDFLKGRFTGISLSRDGRLTLAPKLDAVFSTDQPEIWTVVKAPDGNLYLGTGHRGRVYRVDSSGHGTLIWTAEQPEIFALAVDDKGILYAATSPDGRVYRIENGKATEFFAPGAKYIWSLLFAPDGALFVGTGDQGKIFRVTPDGKGAVYYESGQAHITALAVDAQGRLLAGSEPNGIVYRLTGPNKAFVLYDANLPEIRTILPTADGTVYVAALGGSMSKRTAGAAGSGTGTGGTVVTAPATSITVTDSNAQAGPPISPPKPDPSKPTTSVTSTIQPVVQTGVTYDTSGIDKSAVYKIHSDNTVETIWTSKDENIYDLAAQDGRLIFATDVQGRIYRLTPDRKATLIAQTNEGETTRLLASGDGLLATTGNMGKVYRLTQGTAPDGFFESPVHDANTVARWGRLSWTAEIPTGTQLVFRTRSGNSLRPDNTWSDWSEPLTDRSSALIKSPNARYLQWRVEFTARNGATPTLDAVTAAYLPQNTPPIIRSVNVSTQPAANAQRSATTAAGSANSPYSVTVTDTGDAASATSSGTPTQTISRGSAQVTQIVWQGEDPDGDRLVYAVFFRGEDEREWKLLRTGISENSLAIDADALADGRYYFRVLASDRPSNPAGLARESDMVSAPILIDNTPPVVTAGPPRRSGSTLDIDVDAADRTSPLRRCEYSVDAGPWNPIESTDGVTDSPREKFTIHIENLRPGEHLVVIRAVDAANNAGLTKVVVH